VFDVEDPGEPGTQEPEVAVRTRRITFYQRHGASVLPVTGYRTPHGDGAEASWTPMLLLAARLSDSGSPAASPSDSESPPASLGNGGSPPASLPAVVNAVYQYRWSLEPDHPQVTSTRLFQDPMNVEP
jgi:hypothetical protein